MRNKEHGTAGISSDYKEAIQLDKKKFFVTCPECGRRLCKAVPGSEMEIECPKCAKALMIFVDDECSVSVKLLRSAQTASAGERK
jgi:ribosomal protein S27E